MDNIPLPSPFTWNDHFAGQALVLHGRAIAFSTPLPNGHVRCTRKVHTRHMSVSFHDSLQHAASFMAAWARRWEREIVELYDDLPTSTYQAVAGVAVGPAPEIAVPRRKGRRRKASAH